MTSSVVITSTVTTPHTNGHQSRYGNTRGQPYPPAVPNNETQVQLMRVLDARVKRIEEQTSSIKNSVEELKRLLEKHTQSNFDIKGSIYEVSMYISYPF